MKYNPKIHHRRSISLNNYDYSQTGAYFVTICTQNRLLMFGEIVNGKMILNEIPIYYPAFNVHELVVMPNHIHGIIVGATPMP